MQPKILVEKLLELNVNVHICSWIFDFLTERPQYVKLKIKNDIFISDITILNVGSPQVQHYIPFTQIIVDHQVIILTSLNLLMILLFKV